eukprot:CAMPEP_0119365822 /NCGR_PEP_ID=MMETSP1334-20130426/12726_1 /TAXON_ID=127549 /ORGANISM="Calcidiscus leptoporus, Strain RCC1130" /LENGTH=308 /DNA_ID=CAMNT_0007381881 /DNA_START=170 /DNA_END=1096 /DNA_ORIENTATION=-
MIYLPSLPADPPHVIQHALALLSQSNCGLKPVPHIAASRVRSEAELLAQLDAWQTASSSAVDEVLVVHGDSRAHSLEHAHGEVHTAASVFSNSLELLESRILQRRGICRVGFCGHPEGIAIDGSASSMVSVGTSVEILASKMQYASSVGLESNVVTQFCFDVDTTTAFVDRLREAGISQAVRLGLVGPASSALLKRMAAHCAVAPPCWTHGDGASQWHGSSTKNAAVPPLELWPTSYVRELAQWQAVRGASIGVQALHLYPFGGLMKTMRWLAQVALEDAEIAKGMGIGTDSSRQWSALKVQLIASTR